MKKGRYIGEQPTGINDPGNSKNGVYDIFDQAELSTGGNWGFQIQTPILSDVSGGIGYGASVISTAFKSGITGDSLNLSTWRIKNKYQGAVKSISNIVVSGFSTNTSIDHTGCVYDPANAVANASFSKAGIGASFTFTYNEFGNFYNDTFEIPKKGRGYEVGEVLRIYEQGGGGSKYIDFTISEVWNAGETIEELTNQSPFLLSEYSLNSSEEYQAELVYSGTSGKSSLPKTTDFSTKNDDDLVSGELVRTSSGSWIVPVGVYRCAILCVAKGGTAVTGNRGGNLRYINYVKVTPGETLSILIDNSTDGTCVKRSDGSLILTAGLVSGNSVPVAATPLSTNYVGGGDGGSGQGRLGDSNNGNGASGGCGGYSGNGGNGGRGDSDFVGGRGGYGAGGGGAGGSTSPSGGKGGGVQIYGESFSGASLTPYPRSPTSRVPDQYIGNGGGVQANNLWSHRPGNAGSWSGIGGPTADGHYRAPGNPGGTPSTPSTGEVNYGGAGGGVSVVRIVWGRGLRAFPKQYVNQTSRYQTQPGSNV